MTDYYEILEVHPNASPEVIARAYRVLVSRYHPDLHPPERRAWAEDRMKRVNEAFSVLSDPQKRADYDRKRQAANLPNNDAQSVVASPVSTPTAPAPPTVVINPAVCVFHPGRPRVSICLECRRSVCGECRVLRHGRPYCRECAQRFAEPATSQPTTPAPLTRRTSSEAQSPRLRLSARGWVNATLAVCALGIWLYVTVAPKVVYDKPSAVLVSALCGALAAGTVFLALMALRAQRLPLRGIGIPLVHSLAAFILLVLLWTGSQQAMKASEKVQHNIAHREAERTRQATQKQAKSYLENFIASFPGHEKPEKGLWQQLSDGTWKWLEQHTGLAEEQETQLNAEEVEPFPNNLPPDKTRAARSRAKKFIGTEYSQRPDQTRNRAVCLHFIVWAELKQPTNTDVTKEAEECLKLAQRAEQKRDCDFYLCLRRMQRGDGQAMPKGLSFITPEIQQQFPEALDQLTRALLSFFKERHDWESLLVLKERYAAAFQSNNPAAPASSGPRAAEIEQAVREALDGQVKYVHQLIRNNDLRAKEEGLKVLKPELQRCNGEAFETLALELGQWLYRSRDKEGLEQLRNQYQTVSALKRHQTQFDRWLNELNPPSSPSPRVQGGH